MRKNLHFYTYPSHQLPCVDNMILLGFDGKELSHEDCQYPLLILDGTWRLTKKIENALVGKPLRRSLPPLFKTAYPRRQEDCLEKSKGLASLEALYLAHLILGKSVEGLLDLYHWKEHFLSKNQLQINKLFC